MLSSVFTKCGEQVSRRRFVEAHQVLLGAATSPGVRDLRTLLDELLGQAPGGGLPAGRVEYGVEVLVRWVPRAPRCSAHKMFHDPFFKDAVNDLRFVTASDSEYLPLLRGCVRSILACRHFAPARVVVLDCGFTEAERQEVESLDDRVQVVPLTAHRWFWEGVCQGDPRMASILCRGFLPELLKDARYCFWMDADAWILDESGVAEYLSAAKIHGIGLPEHPFGCAVQRHSHWMKRGTLTPRQVDAVIGQRAIIACCFCADLSSEAYGLFAATLRDNLARLGAKWGLDQEVLLYTMSVLQVPPLATEYAFEGTPLLEFDAEWNHVLYARPHTPVYIYHLGGGIKERQRKWEVFGECLYVRGQDDVIHLTTSKHFFVPPRRSGALLEQLIAERCGLT